MCFGSGAAEEANRMAAQQAAEAKRRERRRQADIRAGKSSIDTSFAQFDDPYFEKFRTDYVGAQTPNIDRQYAVAKDRLTAALANRGVLASTISGNAFGDLVEKQNDARSRVTNEAFDAANNFRNQVEKTKSNLYTLNAAAADPSMISARAAGEAGSLVAPTATTPLGDLFASTLAPYANYQAARLYAPYSRNTYGSPPTVGSGSGRVVS
jgi:hypothetical protein